MYSVIPKLPKDKLVLQRFCKGVCDKSVRRFAAVVVSAALRVACCSSAAAWFARGSGTCPTTWPRLSWYAMPSPCTRSPRLRTLSFACAQGVRSFLLDANRAAGDRATVTNFEAVTLALPDLNWHTADAVADFGQRSLTLFHRVRCVALSALARTNSATRTAQDAGRTLLLCVSYADIAKA